MFEFENIQAKKSNLNYEYKIRCFCTCLLLMLIMIKRVQSWKKKSKNINKIPETKFFIRRLEQIRIPGDYGNNIKTKTDKCYEEKC